MRKILMTMAAASALALGAGAATAQVSAFVHEQNLEARIEAGLRSGDLTVPEARTLRAEVEAVTDLERRYAANGLTRSERIDLDRRYDALTDRIQLAMSDIDRDRSWVNPRSMNFAQRENRIERRIERGVASGRLTRAEAIRLENGLEWLDRLEMRYRLDGMTRWERADLHRRFDALETELRIALTDSDRRYGYGYGWYDDR